jgi:hypothetical protein
MGAGADLIRNFQRMKLTSYITLPCYKMVETRRVELRPLPSSGAAMPGTISIEKFRGGMALRQVIYAGTKPGSC